MTAVLPMPDEGTLLANKYVVGKMLGRGGMGAVFEASHKELGTPFAVKLLLDLAGSPAEAKTRFLNEARMSSLLTSAHAVRTFDVDLWKGVPFIVMEYLQGHDLARTLRERGRLRLSEAADAIVEACHALHEAHSHRIVHRDIKPANLFLARAADGHHSIKVLDFGVSKTPMAPTKLTGPVTFLGSPADAAPEQIESASSVDARADLWSLGVTLFELLAGMRCFKSPNPAETIALVMSGPIPRPEEHIKDCPSAVAAAIRRCLERNRDLRPSSAAELALALAPHGSARSQLIASRLGGSPLYTTLPIGHSSSPGPTPDLDTQRNTDPVPTLETFAATLITAPPSMDPPIAHEPRVVPANPFAATKISASTPSTPSLPVRPMTPSGTFDGVVATRSKTALGVAVGVVALALAGAIATVFVLKRQGGDANAAQAPALAVSKEAPPAVSAQVTQASPTPAEPTEPTPSVIASVIATPAPPTSSAVTRQPSLKAPAPPAAATSAKPKSAKSLARNPEDW